MYQICPTCGGPLSPIVYKYLQDMKALCEKYKIDHERISAQPIGDPKFNQEKKDIIDKYVAKDRLCCRMRITNFSDIVKLVH